MQESGAKVVAVDVGYGNVKYAFGRGDKLQLGLFPSIAPAATNGECVGAGMQRRNTVTVDVGDMAFEVGVDAALAADSSYQRVTDEDYPESNQYHALLLGAMSYMNLREIDLLVLGLPLLTFNRHKESLEKKFCASHIVPRIQHPNSNEPELKVNVKKVMVLPQPMGGLFAYAAANQDRKVSNETSLIVDVGFYTVDWIYSAGFKPYPAKSGAMPGGMNSIYKAIAESLKGELKKNVSSVNRIDEALRQGLTTIRLHGKEVELRGHITAGMEKARQFVAAIANSVGDGETLDNIVLVGGGSKFIEPIIRERYPDHNIEVLESPVYSNVTGFQFAGTKTLKMASGE